MPDDGYDFGGKVALVTGGGTGIGAATAMLLARYGADLAIAGRTPATLTRTAQAIESATGCRCLRIRADVTQEAQVAAMVAHVVQTLGRIDVLVNNAGWYERGRLSETSMATWRSELARNLDSTFLCTQAVRPHMQAQRSGAIVNMSSVAGVDGLQGLASYSTAKAGVQMFTRVAAAEWGRYGIRINCVAPGLIATESVVRDFEADGVDYRRLAAIYPLRRPGQPEDVARAIAFLASDAAAYVTGQTLAIDGGPLLGGQGS